MPIEYRKMIFRPSVRMEPNALFVFGDNMKRYGKGGQAKEMRGEPNVVGIPTKNSPANHDAAYFSDADFEKAKPEIDAAFARLAEHLQNGGKVVWPADGIGTGLADLENRAPRIWEHIEERLSQLEVIAAGNDPASMVH